MFMYIYTYILKKLTILNKITIYLTEAETSDLMSK